MKACKCDRCGAFFEPHHNGSEFCSRVIQTGEETFDLMDSVAEIDGSYDICDSCYQDFRRWLRRGAIKKATNK